MKLIDLVTRFRGGETFGSFCASQQLDETAEVIEIYAQEPVTLDSELQFFPIEATEGRIRYSVGGLQYHNLFDFFYFLDAMEEIAAQAAPPENRELARILLDHAINDA